MEETVLHGSARSLPLQLGPTGSMVDEEMDSELAFPLLDHSSSSCDSSSNGDIEELIIKLSWQGPLLLLGASFLFATLNISLRAIYSLPGPPSPSALSMTRGWLTMGLFVPLWIHKRYHQKSHTSSSIRQHHQSQHQQHQHQEPVVLEKSIWFVAAELAFWNFTGQGLFNYGIEFCSSARASFLGQTTVVMVPLICAMRGEALRWWDGIGCVCSLVGIILLSLQDDNEEEQQHNDPVDPDTTYTDTNGDPQFHLSLGDILLLASALCWSFYLIKTSQYAKHFDSISLQGSKNVILSLLYSGWFLLAYVLRSSDTSLWPGWHNGITWAILIYSAIGPGVIADLIQQKGQESAGPTECNLILCMESLFTAILGRILLGEETSWIEKLGGTFLVAGALVSSLE